MQQTQIALVGLALFRDFEPVVGLAEDRAGEKLLAIKVAGKGSRLADQGVDDVPVIDGRGLPRGTWILGDYLAVEGEAHRILAQLRLDQGADEPGGHRVGAAADPGRRMTGHPDRRLLGVRQSSVWQRPEAGAFLGEFGFAQRIDAAAHRGHERGIRRDRGKVAAAAQDQMVFEPALQHPLKGFDIPVLIRARDGDRAWLQPEMRAQGLVVGVEAAGALVAFQLVGGG